LGTSRENGPNNLSCVMRNELLAKINEETGNYQAALDNLKPGSSYILIVSITGSGQRLASQLESDRVFQTDLRV